MNFQHIVFLDFETGSRNPYKTQPIQLAAVVLDARKLEVRDEYCSLIKPEIDPKVCAKLGVDPLEDEAMAINKKDVNELVLAPSPKMVWSNFTEFVNRHNPKKDEWTAPIMAGANIYGFDDIIINRLAEQYGSYDEETRRCTLFNKIHKYDLLHDFFRWFENKYTIKRLSMNAMREMLGMDASNAHDALQDCRDGAKILTRFINLYRKVAPTVRFKPKAKENKDVEC